LNIITNIFLRKKSKIFHSLYASLQYIFYQMLKFWIVLEMIKLQSLIIL